MTLIVFFLIIRRPPISTLFPYTTLFLSDWVDGYKWVNINAYLLVLEATIEITESGVHTPGLVVAAIDRWPQNDVELLDRKRTRLNSSHANISYAVFCL